MPPAPNTTFSAFFAAESEAPLPSGDATISAALDAYGAVYSKGSSKKLKDLREETLAGLSWLHLNHEDVASALRRITVQHQQLLASALGLDHAAHSGKPQWPTMLSRAIAARAVPGDTVSTTYLKCSVNRYHLLSKCLLCSVTSIPCWIAPFGSGGPHGTLP